MGFLARTLGVYDRGRDGPTFIVVGALHGNELAGTVAIERVLSRLEDARLPLCGRLIGLRGNLRAVAAEQRFLARDFNRIWTPSRVERVLAGRLLDAEAHEMHELFGVLRPHLEEGTRPIVLVDLHSTSGKGVPFSVGADVPRNRSALFSTGVPVVLGLEDAIGGSLARFVCDHGHTGIAIEAGPEVEPETAELHVAALWCVMVSQGMLAPDTIPDYAQHVERLRRAAEGSPAVVEIIHRQVVRRGQPFEMEPGWRSFAPVLRGQTVAHGPDGPIRSPHTGLMLLPRYQGQGDDGFFVVRPIRRPSGG